MPQLNDNTETRLSPENSLSGFFKVSISPDGKLASDGRFQYTWDGENRLVSVESVRSVGVPPGDCLKLEFAYDYMSRRISKKVYSWSTDHWSLTSDLRFAYDGWNCIASFTVNGQQSTVNETYTWGEDLSGSLQGAGGVGGLLAVSNSNGTYFPCYDGNGNVTAYVDSSGTKVAEFEYSPNPSIIGKSGSKADELAQVASFSTMPYEKELDAFRYPFRILKEGRWLSRDPIEEKGGINIYCFAYNNAINKIEYLGLKTLDEILAQYKTLIEAARKDGKNVAAGNLEYFLSAKGGTKTLDWKWLRGFSSVLEGEETNKKRFLDKSIIPKILSGKSSQYDVYDYWDSSQKASKFGELYYASGTFTITSYG